MKHFKFIFFSMFFKRLSVVLALVVVSLTASAKTIVVRPGSEMHSISQAIAIALAGDSIELKEGRYFENKLIIKKQLTIFSTENAIMDGGGESEDIFIVAADGVEISGIAFRNVGVSFLQEASAIRLVGCKYGKITRNKIDSCFFGIYLENAKNAEIHSNDITGFFEDEASAGNAIHAWKCDSLLITNNRSTHHRDGIYFEFVDNSLISRNTSKHNLRYGLHFMFSNDDRYEENVFERNGAGVAVMFSRNIAMVGNRFEHNWGGASYGLLLKEISDGSIRGNVFVENTIGILAEGANRLIMRMNTFKLNGTALDIKGNCLDNEIIQNDFIANTFDVVTNTKYNNNHFEENYWSIYTGYDRNKDGFGDVPFRPVNLFAKITHKVPAATFLLQSPFVKLIEMGEKIFPQFIPESLVDEKPKIKAYDYD